VVVCRHQKIQHDHHVPVLQHTSRVAVHELCCVTRPCKERPCGSIRRHNTATLWPCCKARLVPCKILLKFPDPSRSLQGVYIPLYSTIEKISEFQPFYTHLTHHFFHFPPSSSSIFIHLHPSSSTHQIFHFWCYRLQNQEVEVEIKKNRRFSSRNW